MENLILNKEQCITFLKNYDEYKQNNLKKIKNPKTNGYLSKIENIEFAKNKCIELLKLVNSSDDSLKLKKIDAYDLINLPLYNDMSIFFKNNLDYDKELKYINEYINDNLNNKDIIKFKDIEQNIKEFIPIYNINLSKDDLIYFIKNHYKNDDNNTKFVLTIASKYLREILIKSDNNNNISDFNKNIKNYNNKYYALFFTLNLIKNNIFNAFNRELINQQLYIIDKLLNEKIKIEDNSLSISISSNTNTKSDSSSPKGSTYSRIYYKAFNITKEDYLQYIFDKKTGKVRNDYDIISNEKWEDMNKSKLKNVIKITDDSKNSNFATIFLIKDIYKLWNDSVKENKDFINPLTNELFTDKNKDLILNKIQEIYPLITKPKLSKTRKDLIYTDILIPNINPNYYGKRLIKIMYKNNDKIFTTLIEIEIPLKYIDKCISNDLDMIYFPGEIIEKIKKLFDNNKILGKTIPFVIHKAFINYNLVGKLPHERIKFIQDQKSLDNIDNYKNFCDLLL
jgi:hypothetical protein|tara:strand:+ start:14747 stop:16276 length:1530 start_codon:yes stop_codon:yes gene_type:complete